MERYSHVVFIDLPSEFDEAMAVYDIQGSEALADYLAQWDYGDDYDVRDYSSAGTIDDQFSIGDYLITLNRPLGYVGMERVIKGGDNDDT